ncbi:peptidoglycan DD-metalloendopeptidase family protein [Kocuria sp. TGY1127_2]|uniref:peptidoglycan DD-metalloendopeptidase family protein n=1 Tax=Kocuria sp. TGY1127_2 TaxID=2711328 RepID=UPI001FAB55A9|nr:peptidoglycan DD-metalloendopeptidase family protein [Kocuria sp. TGY1127_2]
MLDVSGYQAGISASALSQSEIALAVKVTEGTGESNTDWRRQAQTGLDQGRTVLLYHFPRLGDSDPQAEAYLTATSGWWGQGRVIPVLDWEEASYTAGILDYPDFAADWLARVASRTGTTPWIYAGPSTAARGDHAGLKKYPLWLAAYPYSTRQGWGAQASLDWAVGLVGGLPGWTIAAWQYTGTGRIDGYGGDIDMSELYATKDDLARWAGGTASGASASAMILPVGEAPISQDFGQNGTQYNLASGGHTGRDYAVPTGTTVKASLAGTVVWADWVSNLPGDDSAAGWASRWYLHKQFGGICVVIDHGDFLTVYAHLNSTGKNPGDRVSTGDPVGESGATGAATGPHLHWEVLPKPFAWSNGYYGRVHPYNFLTTYNASHTAGDTASVATKDWFDMASRQDLAEVVNDVLHQNDGFIRRCIHDVIHNEKFNREGSINGKPVGGQTTLVTEAQYSAQNFGRLKADVLFAQKQIADLKAEIATLKEGK